MKNHKDFQEPELSKRNFEKQISSNNQVKELFQQQNKSFSDPHLLISSFEMQKVLNTSQGDNALQYYTEKYSLMTASTKD